MSILDDPRLGALQFQEAFAGHVSEQRSVRFLGGKACRFVLKRYSEDPAPHDLHAAIHATLDASPDVLTAAEPHALAYCRDMLPYLGAEKRRAMSNLKPGEVWSHVKFGDTFYVSRRARGDSTDGIYLSLECNCDWEIEHGLQLVLRDGKAISKLGPFDGFDTNSDGSIYSPD